MLEEVEDMKEVYEIKIADEEYEDEAYRIKEDHLLDSYEERIDNTIEEYEIDEIEESGNLGSSAKCDNEQFEIYENETEPEAEAMQKETPSPPSPLQSARKQTASESHQHTELPTVATTSPSKNIIDPDERYLMSCLPAFKRFTPQQKAYVRMGIERLFYEVEFENISDFKPKRSKI